MSKGFRGDGLKFISLLVFFSLFLILIENASAATVCWTDPDCTDYCSGSTRYYNGDCFLFVCSYSSVSCSYGCSNGACLKGDGSICSSDSECSSGTCGDYSGKCTSSCTNECGLYCGCADSYNICAESDIDSDGCSDKVYCQYGCENGVCKKKPDGTSCSAASECAGGYCVHSKCRSASTYCGDGFCDTGETSSNCLNDCKKSNGQSCTSDSDCQSGNCGDYSKTCVTCADECGFCGCTDNYLCGQFDSDGCSDKIYCQYGCTVTECNKAPDGTSCSAASECAGGYCVHSKCRSASTYCGDGFCDTGETYSNCNQDCKKPDGTSCSASSECQSGTCGDYSKKCTSSCTNDCGLYCGCIDSNYKCAENDTDNDGCSDKIYCQYGCDNFGVCNKAPDGTTCSSNDECSSGFCAEGAKKCWSASSCANKCTSWYWAKCYNPGETCCNNDAVANQYYCKQDYSWDECRPGSHVSCQQQGKYSCTLTNNIWSWRECTGCYEGACIRNITCSSNSECPVDSYTGSNYCSDLYGDVYRLFQDYYCLNPGTTKSSCGITYLGVLQKDCQSSEICQEGQCKPNIIPFTASLEDADLNTRVYKQPGDLVSVIVNTDRDQDLVLNSPPSFVFVKGDYRNGMLSAKYGMENIVTFQIPDTTANGFYNFTIGNKKETIEVIRNPQTLILTDRNALKQRYGNSFKVNDVLKEAYKQADSQRGVVYSLDYYLEGRPWSSYSAYNEDLLNPFMKNNNYSMQISALINKKCDDCSNVLIVGDDFIVPHYRRDIKWLNWYLISSSVSVNTIYTDIPYVQRKSKYFSEFDELFKIDGEFQGKDVLFILPDSVSSDMRSEIAHLKSVLTERGYKPDFENVSSSSITCNDRTLFTKYAGKTIFVVGTENYAYNCFPFVPRLEDSASIEINPWDGENYAVIIDTDNEDVMRAFSNLIESKSYVNLKTESAYFFKVGTEYAGYAAMGIGFAALAVGTGGAAPAALLAAGAVLDGVSDGAGVMDSCFVNNDGYGWCAASVGFAVVPMVSSGPAKKLLKEGFESFDYLPKSVREFIIDRVGKAAKYSDGFGDEASMARALRNNNPKYVARGYERLLGSADISDLNIVKNRRIYQDDLAEGLKNLGKLDEAGAEMDEFIPVLKGQGDNVGHWAEVKRAADMMDDNMEVISVGKTIKVGDISFEKEILLKNAWKDEAIIEEVKNVNTLNLDTKFKAQLDQMAYSKGKVIETSKGSLKITETHLVVNKNAVISPEVLEYASGKGIDVILVNGVKAVT